MIRVIAVAILTALFLAAPLAAPPAAYGQRVVTFALGQHFDIPNLTREQELEGFALAKRTVEAACGVEFRLVASSPSIWLTCGDTCQYAGGKCALAQWLSQQRWIRFTNSAKRWNAYGTELSIKIVARGILHEWGHSIGWGHASDQWSMMSIDLAVDDWSPTEKAALVRAFGPPRTLPATQHPAGTFLLAAANANVRFGDGTGIGLVGRWRDGRWGLGTYNPATSVFSGRFSLTAGPPEFAFQFGSPGLGLQPVIADYDFDGSDNVGVYNPKTGRFLFRRELAPGKADYDVTYGPVGGAMAVSGLGVGVYVIGTPRTN